MKRVTTRRKGVRYYKHETIKKSKSENKLIQDTTLLIGFFTILGYYVAFSYEEGYKTYFSLPNIFLDDVNLVNVLSAMAALSVVWLIMYIFYKLFLNFQPKNENVRYFFKKVLMMPLFFGLLFILILPRGKSIYIMVLTSVLIALAIKFIAPLSSKEKGYINKLKAYSGNEESITVEGIFDVITNNNGALIIVLFAVSLGISNLANLIGYGKASKEENYLIIKEPTPYVVIDNDKDNLILPLLI